MSNDKCVIELADICALSSCSEVEIGGESVPERPVVTGSRWRAAWLVLIGRADALVWPKQ